MEAIYLRGHLQSSMDVSRLDGRDSSTSGRGLYKLFVVRTLGSAARHLARRGTRRQDHRPDLQVERAHAESSITPVCPRADCGRRDTLAPLADSADSWRGPGVCGPGLALTWRPGSITCLQRTEPRTGHLGRSAVALVHGGESGEDGLAVDEPGSYERCDEIPVLSRKAQSLATQRSSLSRHQPVYWGSPSGAAVLAFWTLTSRPRQPVGSADVLRSTPSMLNPWSSSNGENSPATPSMMSARRAVSELSSAMGSMSISPDMVASAGSWSRRVSLPLGGRLAVRLGGAGRPWATPRAFRWSRGRGRSGPGAGRAHRRARRATPTDRGCDCAAGQSRHCGAVRGCAR